MKRDLNEMKKSRRSPGGGKGSTHLRKGQNDSKWGQAVLLQHVFLQQQLAHRFLVSSRIMLVEDGKKIFLRPKDPE